MKCRRCKVDMVPGHALINLVTCSDDFPGDAAGCRPGHCVVPGHTLSATGPAVDVEVVKCPGCGHSIRA